MSILWEWLDNVSLGWYAVAAAFILTITWLVYEIHCAPVINEEEPVQHTYKPTRKQTPD